MRLFIAIPLTAPLKRKVQKLQQSLPSAVRKQSVEQMHITLRFLGETSPEKAELLKNKLTDIHETSFSLTIQGTGSFPKRGKPKVIWTGVEENKLLTRLHEKVEEACVATGFRPEKRAFTPHVTLGRAKKSSIQDIKKWIEQYENRQIANLPVNRFVLFRSRQKTGGVVHETIKKYILLGSNQE